MRNNTKVVVDGKAKRAYRGVLNKYGGILNARLNAGKLTEEKFWRLQEKINQWYSNYTPMIEVNDFSEI